MEKLNYPNLRGKTEREQIGELKEYLFQLVDQLQYALNSLEKASKSETVNAQDDVGGTLDLIKSRITGVRIHTKSLVNRFYFDIDTKYTDFEGRGDEAQTFHIFGETRAALVHGVARVFNHGPVLWSGTEGVGLTALDGGILRVTLPDIAYDIFTIISAQDFETI